MVIRLKVASRWLCADVVSFSLQDYITMDPVQQLQIPDAAGSQLESIRRAGGKGLVLTQHDFLEVFGARGNLRAPVIESASHSRVEAADSEVKLQF